MFMRLVFYKELNFLLKYKGRGRAQDTLGPAAMTAFTGRLCR